MRFVIGLLVLIACAAPAHAMDQKTFDERLALYTHKLQIGIDATAAEKKTFCPNPRSETTAQCTQDYDALIAAVEAERSIGVQLQREVFASHGRSQASKELETKYKGATENSDRLLKLTRQRYWIQPAAK